MQACQLAIQMKPKTSELEDSLRNLSAQATMQKGRYDDEESDFRNSIKDKEDQEKLRAQDQLVRDDDILLIRFSV